MIGNETIGKRIQYFFDNQKAIHCQTKGGRWYNGYILEVNADFFILNEFKVGELPVFFIEVEEVTQYVPK